MAKKDLKAIVEKGIMEVLESKEEPSDGRIKALTLGIKMCALNAKLEESEYGDYFRPDDDTDGLSQRKDGTQPAARVRKANGGADA